jgi:uncharacterized damage-inducible protein DinB
MKENQRIIKLFEDLYKGDPWIDANLVDTLKKFTAEQAAKNVRPGWNSIWQIVNHLMSWRYAVLERLNSRIFNSPEDNFITPLPDTSEAAWNKTMENLEDSQQKWLVYLGKITDEELETVPDKKPYTRYELIHGIIQHDAYHLGQIRILAKLV